MNWGYDVRSLLDVNVLIALLDRNHAHHSLVANWIDGHIEQGWATCPIIQNGCLRVLSQPRYPRHIDLTEAAERLRLATSTRYHQFVADDVSLLDETVVDSTRITGHRQVTDVYLLALAVAHGARLVTMDMSVPLAAVRDAKEDSLLVISPWSR